MPPGMTHFADIYRDFDETFVKTQSQRLKLSSVEITRLTIASEMPLTVVPN